MMLHTRQKTSTHPQPVLTKKNTKYVKNANIHPCLTLTGTHDPRIALGPAEMFLSLCEQRFSSPHHNLGSSKGRVLKGKCKTVPVYHVTVRGGFRSVAPVVLNLCTRWKRVISFKTPDVSNAGKGSSQNLLSRGMGGLHLVCTFWKHGSPSSLK